VADSRTTGDVLFASVDNVLSNSLNQKRKYWLSEAKLRRTV